MNYYYFSCCNRACFTWGSAHIFRHCNLWWDRKRRQGKPLYHNKNITLEYIWCLETCLTMCNPTTRFTSAILQLATNAISQSYALAVFYNMLVRTRTRHPNNIKSCWWLLEVFLITHICSFCCVPLFYLCLFHYSNHLVPVSIDWLRQLQPRCIPWSRSTMCNGMQICRTRFTMHLCWTQSSNCNAMQILTIRSTNCSAMQICRTRSTN